MTIGMIACSKKAYSLMLLCRRKLEQVSPDIKVMERTKCSLLPDLSMKQSITTCVGEWWHEVDAIIFFAAAGIAVRSIAPYVTHKSKDPCVLAIDEMGCFCIPLLSGHMGGGNELAEKIAQLLQAMPVITTATDREGKFAVDDFARKNQMVICDWDRAKEIAVRILNDERVMMTTDIPTLQVEGGVPKELVWQPDHCGQGSSLSWIMISYKHWLTGKSGAVQDFLQLIPRVIIVGIGCRKGTGEEKIAQAVSRCLEQEQVLPEAVSLVASIDLKKEEPGLVEYCTRRKLPFVTYSAGQLSQLEGDFSVSAFVGEVTGVTCVCERSAVMASGGRLLCRKKVFDSVTVALAEKKGSVQF